MSILNLGIEIRDFDLERMGFSLSVLDESKKRQASEAYLRMTLTELDVFLKALKSAHGDLDLTTYDSSGVNKLPPLKASRRGQRAAQQEGRERGGRVAPKRWPSSAAASVSRFPDSPHTRVLDNRLDGPVSFRRPLLCFRPEPCHFAIRRLSTGSADGRSLA